MLLWQQCNCNFEEQHLLCVPASTLSWWWNYVWLSFWFSCWQTVGASLQEFRIMSWHHWCLNVQSKCVCVCVPASKQHQQLHPRWWFGFPWRRIVRFLLEHPWTHRSFTILSLKPRGLVLLPCLSLLAFASTAVIDVRVYFEAVCFASAFWSVTGHEAFEAWTQIGQDWSSRSWC